MRVEDFWRPSGARLRVGMLVLGDIYEMRPRPSKSIDGRSVFYVFIQTFPGPPPSGSRERVVGFWRPSGVRLRVDVLRLGDIYAMRPRPSKSVKIESCF